MNLINIILFLLTIFGCSTMDQSSNEVTNDTYITNNNNNNSKVNFVSACTSEMPNICVQEAIQLGEEDPNWEPLLDKSCIWNNATACFLLGLYFEKLNQKDKAYPFLVKACEKGELRACIFSGNYEGSKTFPYYAEQKKHYVMACESYIKEAGEACSLLAGVENELGNIDAAKSYGLKGCSLHVGLGCLYLTSIYSSNGQELIANEYRTKAKLYLSTECNNGNNVSCAFLVIIEKQNQKNLKLNKCCKICADGKACGDSCISISDLCNKPSGCACQK